MVVLKNKIKKINLLQRTLNKDKGLKEEERLDIREIFEAQMPTHKHTNTHTFQQNCLIREKLILFMVPLKSKWIHPLNLSNSVISCS